VWIEYSKPVDLTFSFIPPHLQHFFNVGYLGVDLFFVLSGCVIVNSALQNSPSAFASNRFTRLYPAYLISSLVTLALYSLAGGKRGIMEGFYWLTGFPLLTTSDPYIGPAWTLHHEILFYLLIFLIIKVAKNKRKNLIICANLGSFAIFGGLIFRHLTQTSFAPNSFILLLPYFLLGLFTHVLVSRQDWIYSSLGFLLTSLLVIYELHYRIGLKSYIQPLVFFFFILLVILLSKIEIMQDWSPPRTIKNLIKKAALMTYPVYLLHLTAGGALISFLFGFGVPILLSIFLSGFFVTFISWLIVQIFEPKFKLIMNRSRE